jgi:hypothetical protein
MHVKFSTLHISQNTFHGLKPFFIIQTFYRHITQLKALNFKTNQSNAPPHSVHNEYTKGNYGTKILVTLLHTFYFLKFQFVKDFGTFLKEQNANIRILKNLESFPTLMCASDELYTHTFHP